MTPDPLEHGIALPAAVRAERAVFGTIDALQDAYDQGLRVVDVISGCLSRIGAQNGALRALIHIDAPRAMQAARQADAQRRAGLATGPLHGVPVAVKDMIDVRGWPTTCGSRLFANRIAEESAACVQRLEAAGAIIIGKTNLHELCAGGHDNPWFGKVINPLDAGRGTGGTSSGSAAAVAAGFCMAALGTDSGGSNRSPAAATGLWGMKPTQGLVDMAGVQPMVPSFDCVGPITRGPADLQAVMSVLAPSLLRQEAAPAVNPTVALSPDLPGAEVDEAVTAAIADWLERTGCRVVHMPFPARASLEAAGLTVLLHEFAQSFGRAIDGAPASVGTAAQAFLAEGRKISTAAYDEARSALADLHLDFADIDLWAVPTSPGLAPRLADEMTQVDGRWHSWGGSGGSFRRWANALGLPALALPVATSGPIPASLQLAAAPGQDGRLLQLSRHLWSAAQEKYDPDA